MTSWIVKETFRIISPERVFIGSDIGEGLIAIVGTPAEETTEVTETIAPVHFNPLVETSPGTGSTTDEEFSVIGADANASAVVDDIIGHSSGASVGFGAGKAGGRGPAVGTPETDGIVAAFAPVATFVDHEDESIVVDEASIDVDGGVDVADAGVLGVGNVGHLRGSKGGHGGGVTEGVETEDDQGLAGDLADGNRLGAVGDGLVEVAAKVVEPEDHGRETFGAAKEDGLAVVGVEEAHGTEFDGVHDGAAFKVVFGVESTAAPDDGSIE